MREFWKIEAEGLYAKYGRQWSVIADKLMPQFPGLKHFEVKEKIRRYIRDTPGFKAEAKEDKSDADISKKPVGVFSDPHIPFNHPNYLRFVKDTFEHYGVGQVVCCGDLVDNHAISRHLKETCAKSACDELDLSIAEVKKFVEAFPNVKLCIGNHDERIISQAATVGIDRRFLKSFSELLEIPKTWEVAEEFIIDDVLYKHGVNCVGQNGAINSALRERMSTVIGHSHAFGGVGYSANPRSIIFGMNVGCGIDISAYAFAYGKHDKYRPTLGCGIVFGSGRAIFEPMRDEYFRD